jgi:hypothetical protein
MDEQTADERRAKATGRRMSDHEFDSIRASLMAGDERMNRIEEASITNAKEICEIRKSIEEPLQIILAFKGTASVLVWLGKPLKWLLGLSAIILSIYAILKGLDK